MDPVLSAIDAAFGEEPTPSAPTRDHGKNVLEESERIAKSAEALEERKRADEEIKRNNRGIFRRTPVQQPPMTVDDCDRFIDAEMATRMTRTRWHHLDACFRWKKITEYLQAQHPEQDLDIEDLRHAFRTKKLDKVTYDIKTQTVLRLNHLGL